jgi:hypothetical protein
MINGFVPTLHPDYEIQSRVAFTLTGHVDEPERTGKIIGIANINIAFTYIVLLDEPLDVETHQKHEAIVLWGTLIKRVI